MIEKAPPRGCSLSAVDVKPTCVVFHCLHTFRSVAEACFLGLGLLIAKVRLIYF